MNKNWHCIIQFKYSLKCILWRNFDLSFQCLHFETLYQIPNQFVSSLFNPSIICYFCHLVFFFVQIQNISILRFFCYLDQFMHAEAEAARSKANTKAFHFHFPFGKETKQNRNFFFLLLGKKILWKDKTMRRRTSNAKTVINVSLKLFVLRVENWLILIKHDNWNFHYILDKFGFKKCCLECN